MMGSSLRPNRSRIIGALGFAVFNTMVFSLSQLLGDGLDVASLAGVLPVAALVGYLAWPGIEDVWRHRDKGEDGTRVLMIGLGLGIGFALSRAVAVLAGEDDARWSLGLWFASVVAIVVMVIVQLRRARRR